MDSRADSHDLVRVHTLVGFLTKQLFGLLLDARHPGLAADQHHLVNRRQARVTHAVAAGGRGAFDQTVGELLQLGSRKGYREVLRPAGVGSDERQVDFRCLCARQLALRLFGRLLQTLQGHGVLGEIDPVLPFELLDQPVHDGHVHVVAAQMRVAVGGFHLENAITNIQDRDVEGSAAEIVYGDLFILFLVKAVSQRGGGGLVDDAQHLQPGNPPRVFGRLALAVVKVSRNRDHRLCDLLAEIGFGVSLQLLQHHGRYLGRRKDLVADLDVRITVRRTHNLIGHHRGFVRDLVILPPHEPLDRINRVSRIRDRLPFRRLTDKPLTALGESHDGRGRPRTLGIGQYDRFATLHDRHARICRSQINP